MENKFVLPIFGKASLRILFDVAFKLFLKVVEAIVLLKKLLLLVTLLLSVDNNFFIFVFSTLLALFIPTIEIFILFLFV